LNLTAWNKALIVNYFFVLGIFSATSYRGGSKQKGPAKNNTPAVLLWNRK
jgi:hypothetical protein